MDVKFNTFYQGTKALRKSQEVTELDTIMQPYVDRFNNGEITKEQLAEVRKREANILANKKELERQQKEQKRLDESIDESNVEEVKKEKRKQNIEETKKYTKMYENNNPLYQGFRPDATKKQKFFDLEEEDAKKELESKLKGTNFKIEETNVTTRYDRGGTEDPSDDVNIGVTKEGINIFTTSDDESFSYDAIKITAPNGEELLLEFDQGGFIGHGTDQEASRIQSYNQLANFLDTHLTEQDKQIWLQNSKDASEIYQTTLENELEPTEEEYQARIKEKNLESIDIFDEKEDYVVVPGSGGMMITKEFGGYEDEIKEARTQLIKERKNAASVSDMPYKDPTIDEVKERALLNLRKKEREYVRDKKYDKYLTKLEDFDDFTAGFILERAKKEGVNLTDDYERLEFHENIRKEMKEKYYQLKSAQRDEEADAILGYTRNDIALNNYVSVLEKSEAFKRYQDTNEKINNKNYKFPSDEKQVQLENGKIIPLSVWEQHMRDYNEISPALSNVTKAIEKSDEYIAKIKDRSYQWDMIKRNYNDFQRSTEVLGYGFGKILYQAPYGIAKLLSLGYIPDDESQIKLKEVVNKQRQTFRKDVKFENAFEDGNFGRFMGQAAIDQIPIYATLATGKAGLAILGGSVFGDKWTEMTMEERYSNGFINHPQWKKWSMSLGYAASEIVLDYFVTQRLVMRNAKQMMMGGTGKALIDNSSNAFFKNYTKMSLGYSPVVESISEGSTQIAQNVIDGKPIFENLDHAAFLGLSMGFGIGAGGYTMGLVNSQFSDHSKFDEVRENLTQYQELHNSNEELKLYRNDIPVKDRSKVDQEIKDNEALMNELLDKNEAIVNEVYPEVKNLTRKAYESFMQNESAMEELKIKAQKIIDGNLSEKQKQKALAPLLAQFNAHKQAGKQFKDLASFGSRWPLIQADKSEKGKKKYNDLIEQAKEKLREDGVLNPDNKKIDEAAKDIWAREEVRKSNKSYKKTNFSKNYNYVEEIEDGVDYIDKQIQEEIDFYNKKLQDGVEEVVIDGEKINVKDHIDDLVNEKKVYISAIRSGLTYGITRITTHTRESKSFSIVATQAKAERFETRVHEGGHQVFWDALMAAGNNAMFEPMAEQILEWTEKNNKGMYNRILLATDGGRQGAAEIVSVFLEEVASMDFKKQNNKNLANLWGLMANKTMFDITGENFEFSGEKNAIRFLVGLSKKIKDGTLNKKDIADIRKSELLRSFITEQSVEKQVGMFSQDASNEVQNIYDTRGMDGAFDIINLFKPITTKIAKRYKEVPGYNQELVVSEIEIGERGILDLIRDYKPESGVPLAAYINKFLPARSIEAANRILEEQFTEDVTERVDVAVEDTDVQVARPKKKVVIADRLGINKKVASAIRRILPDLNIEKLNFKNLKNLVPDITGELFGISPKKIVSLANLTKAELQSAQMFISKNADLLIRILPEGATPSGTATGVPNSLLKAFYTKADRAKMAQTGSKAGLAIQQKNNINRTEFLEVFGIIDGKPVRTDRNTSARVLALANVTGKMITNQALRAELGKSRVNLQAINRISQGKSDAMFSSDYGSTFNIRGTIDTVLKNNLKVVGGKTYRLSTKEEVDLYVQALINDVLPLMPRDFWFGLPDKNGNYGTEFTPSSRAVQNKDIYSYYVQEIKALRNLPDKFFGKQIPGVTDYSRPNYKSLFEGKKGVQVDKINEVNKRSAKIHEALWSRIYEAIQKDPTRARAIGNYFKLVSKKVNHWHRFGAEIVGYSLNPKGDGKKLYEYEHAMPATASYLYLIDAAIKGYDFKSIYKPIMDNFKLIALDAADNKKLSAAGLGNLMPLGWNVIDNVWWERYFNDLVDIDPESIVSLNGNTFKDTYSIVKLQPGSTQGKQLDKAVLLARTTQYSKDSKGITILDFDDTLATTESLVRFTTPDGETGTLNAEQYASTYVDLLDQGYVFDFSEFNKVVKGKIAPLFQKALKLQKKFGPENMFVLTARPPAAQKPIFDFLKANGLNIPLKNITGLGNSTAEAKALWVVDKVAEGYNDFYFADDALQNVQAVDNMLEQFDVKRKVQQAKLMFSRDMDTNFNDILEKTTGIDSKKQFSDVQAKIQGKSSKYKSIIPPSAQDFMGLIYSFVGKGKQGDADLAFFKKALVDPFARGINELNTSRQRAANDLENLNKKLPEVKKKLYKKVKGTNFTNDQAMRVYLWNKAGFEVPGLSKRDQKTLVEAVENDPKLKAYAEAVSLISKQENVYREPKEYWLSENIASDLLDDGAVGDARSTFIAEWIENKNVIFSPKNLNKIQAIYGSKFREALEDVLYAMETGRSRPRDGGRLLNTYTNWVNNSVGAIMFFNMRSALLQTISMTNYINWSDNNPYKAAAAFANQKQYWKDFTFIFNSDFLKQRRTGNRRGINEQELSAAVAGSDNKAKAAIAWLLSKGFLPTQIADSFAIASGGATFYRNRINKYIKEGMTQEQAEKKAFLDFQEVTEVSQQSARPDMISQQQRSPLGRLILAFGNTPMQYARIINKAARDLVNGRGDYKTHISKIAYYGFIQSIIFSALQSALFASLGDDEKEDFNKKKERILNQIVDSMLTGIGFGGKAISTVKNTIITFLDQRDRGFRADHAYTLLQLLSFSPPIGSKVRKVYSSIKTDQYNKDVYMRRGFTLDNPIWQAIGNVVEGITNLPAGRMSNKMLNIDNALDENNKWWQRAALLLGWNTWDLGIRDPDIEEIKKEIKKEKKKASKIKQEIKTKEKQIEKQEEQKALIQENIKKSKKDGRCAAISGSGKRCKNKAVNGGFCTIHEKVESRKDGKQVQCSATKSNGKRCKMKTTNKSGRCYYHD